MNTGIELTITRWSTSSRLRSMIHSHSLLVDQVAVVVVEHARRAGVHDQHA